MTTGIFKAEIAVGDRFRVGTAELVVTQPRLPCYKLGLRFGRKDSSLDQTRDGTATSVSAGDVAAARAAVRGQAIASGDAN